MSSCPGAVGAPAFERTGGTRDRVGVGMVGTGSSAEHQPVPSGGGAGERLREFLIARGDPVPDLEESRGDHPKPGARTAGDGDFPEDDSVKEFPEDDSVKER